MKLVLEYLDKKMSLEYPDDEYFLIQAFEYALKIIGSKRKVLVVDAPQKPKKHPIKKAVKLLIAEND